MSRFQFVEDHKHVWGVKRLCEVIDVARSSFYAWLNAAAGRAARAAADDELAARIRRMQDPKQGGDRAYGAPRVTAELNDGVSAGERVNHKRVARVMREHQLVGIRLRRRVRTTIAEQSDEKFPDLLDRDFSTGESGRRYVGDITYLPIQDGTNLYLATCIDLGSRKLAGWSMADHMRTELVTDALTAAWRARGGYLQEAVFHSDHGSVYTSKAYGQLCKQYGVRQSMGQVGSSADNALARNRSTRHSSVSSLRGGPRLLIRRVRIGRCSDGRTGTTPGGGIQRSGILHQTSTSGVKRICFGARHNYVNKMSKIKGQGPCDTAWTFGYAR